MWKKDYCNINFNMKKNSAGAKKKLTEIIMQICFHISGTAQ